MEENIQAIVIKEGIRQKNFTIKPITPNDYSEKAVKNAEQTAMMRKRREVCNFYQSFKNNFEMVQREKNAESARAHSAKVQQNSQKRPFWQRKKT